ncbi:hypothetical protein Tco_0613570 [Tanacetum coccineum]
MRIGGTNRITNNVLLASIELVVPLLEEEKARRRGKVYNWETTTYGKIWDIEDVHDLGYVETEFPAIVFNDTLTSEATLSCEPTDINERKQIDELVEVFTSLEVLES